MPTNPNKYFFNTIFLNYFLLTSLLLFFLYGQSGALKIIYSFHVLLIFFVVKLEFNLFKLIINSLAIIFLYTFSTSYGSNQIALSILLVLFSFDYENQIDQDIKKNNTFYAIYLVLLLFFITSFLTPHTNNYRAKFTLKDPGKKIELLKEYEKIIIKDIERYYSPQKMNRILKESEKQKNKFGYIVNRAKQDQIKISKITNRVLRETTSLKNDKPVIKFTSQTLPIMCTFFECNIKPFFLEARFRINNLDVNLSTLILMMIASIIVLNIKNKGAQFVIFTILWATICIYTKSRLGMVYGALCFIYFLYYRFFSIKLIILTYLILHIFLIVLGYVFVNSLVDPNLTGASFDLNDNSIIPYHEGGNNFARFYRWFEASSFVRFKDMFSGYLMIVNNINNILILTPGFLDNASNILYTTTNNSVLYISPENHHPHNLLLVSIKKYGLILVLIFHVNIFYMMRHEKFKQLSIPCLFSSAFLGDQLFLVLHILFLFSFINQINFNKFLKSIKKK